MKNNTFVIQIVCKKCQKQPKMKKIIYIVVR